MAEFSEPTRKRADGKRGRRPAVRRSVLANAKDFRAYLGNRLSGHARRAGTGYFPGTKPLIGKPNIPTPVDTPAIETIEEAS